MADDVDNASDRIDLEMAARLSAIPRFNLPSLTECQECGEDIPIQRQLQGSVTRCFDCQNHFEKRR